MYQVIVYRGRRSKVAKTGSYQDCIDWMSRRINPLSQLTGWELKRVPIPVSMVDMSNRTLFGSIRRKDK